MSYEQESFEPPIIEMLQDTGNESQVAVLEDGSDFIDQSNNDSERSYSSIARFATIASLAGVAIFGASSPADSVEANLNATPVYPPTTYEVSHVVFRSLPYQQRNAKCGIAPVHLNSPPNESSIKNAKVGFIIYRSMLAPHFKNIVRKYTEINSHGITVPIGVCKADKTAELLVGMSSDNAPLTRLDFVWNTKTKHWKNLVS